MQIAIILCSIILAAAGLLEGKRAAWLAAKIGGDGRAKVIQPAMEYDPQPPFDSGHMSKASASTKAAATALMSKDLVKPAQLRAMSGLVWDHAIKAARSRRRRRLVTSRG